MKGFKKCSNGHWYKNDMSQCPHCQRDEIALSKGVSTTGGGNDGVTMDFSRLGNDDLGKTMIVGDKKTPPKGISAKGGKIIDPTKTHIIESIETEVEDGSVQVEKGEHRAGRRLVGWLVTYSQDPLGIDYKIYEGRNIIGRNLDCNITVDDNTMSGEHAIILYRNRKYIIEDSLSTRGTVVNLNDIGVRNPVILQDGDIIEMGETVFCFKTTGVENV